MTDTEEKDMEDRETGKRETPKNGKKMDRDAHRLTDEEIQKAKRDYGLGIYGSKKHVNIKIVDGLIAVMVVAVIVCIFLFSRSPGYRVHFDTDGAGEIADQVRKYDERVAEPPAPEKPGYVFEGWYLSNGHRWDFETDLVGNDMELKARYELDPRVLEAIEETARGKEDGPSASLK